jgi:hypothetical protein
VTAVRVAGRTGVGGDTTRAQRPWGPRPRPSAWGLPTGTRDRLLGMARYGATPTLQNRRDITIRCDREVYAQARTLLEKVPGVALSDVVEDFLRDFIRRMTPLIEQLQTVTTREEALPIMERFAAETIGQGMLQLTRETTAFLDKEGAKDKS